MVGFLIGTLCLLGLIATLKRGRRWNRYGGFGPRRALRWFFRRIDASPAQEKAIAEAAEAVRKSRLAMREEMQFLREELGDVLRKSDLTHDDLEAVYTRLESTMRTRARSLFDTVVGAHATLDASQREKLADLLARSRHREPSDGSPYRAIAI
jgi:hypothetical protein